MSEGETNDEVGDPDQTGETQGRSMPAAQGAADAMFNALWKRVLDAWDDDKPHQAALSYALEKQMLPEIAGRYRKLMDDPERGARAKRKVDGIVVAATQMLMATKTPPREKVPWQWTASVAVVMLLVVSFLAYKIFGHH